MTNQPTSASSEEGDIGTNPREKLRTLLQAGAHSKLGANVYASYFEELRSQIKAKGQKSAPPQN